MAQKHDKTNKLSYLIVQQTRILQSYLFFSFFFGEEEAHIPHTANLTSIRTKKSRN